MGSRVSVIIPARNAARTLVEALGALNSQTMPPAEILVVDDASQDDTADVAAAHRSSRVLHSRGGPGAARAAGAGAATGDVLVFTDADCVAEPQFIEELVSALSDGAVAAKGAYTTRQRGLVARFVQVEFEERYRRLAAAPSPDFVDGYAAAYKADVFRAAGGFNPALRLSQNVDLAYRLADAGRRLRFVPTARTRHRHPDTVWAYLRAKAERAFWRVQSYRDHPRRAVADSYTPVGLKLQVVLVLLGALVLAAAAGGLLAPRVAAVVGALLASLFVASAVPFVRLALRLDPPVAVVALPLLGLRAVALAAGTIAGGAAALVPGR